MEQVLKQQYFVKRPDAPKDTQSVVAIPRPFTGTALALNSVYRTHRPADLDSAADVLQVAIHLETKLSFMEGIEMQQVPVKQLAAEIGINSSSCYQILRRMGIKVEYGHTGKPGKPFGVVAQSDYQRVKQAYAQFLRPQAFTLGKPESKEERG